MLEKAKQKLIMAEECYDDAIADYEREIELLRARRDNLRGTRQQMETLSRATDVPRQVIVRSWTSAKNYRVSLYSDPTHDQCECPDFLYRHHVCKHIREARTQEIRLHSRRTVL